MDPAAKKAALRQFTYGLYAVSARTDTDRGIFTANWLSQVSFEPPLVAVSIEHDSSTLSLIRASGRFTVSTFADGQRELAGALGRPKARAGDKFSVLDLPVIETEAGDLALGNAIGFVVCEVRSESSTGDSVLIVGEVVDARVLAEGEPLTMRAAGFRHAG
jgi:flavin reductase (DIM6/NTAB) family NADH-FMN oxidoreductase RutF